MTKAYQLETKVAQGWQFAAITSNGTGVRFELSYKLPETPGWEPDSPVHCTISNGKGKGFQTEGAEALKDWLVLRELGEYQDNLAQFVIDWHARAQAICSASAAAFNGSTTQPKKELKGH